MSRTTPEWALPAGAQTGATAPVVEESPSASPHQLPRCGQEHCELDALSYAPLVSVCRQQQLLLLSALAAGQSMQHGTRATWCLEQHGSACQLQPAGGKVPWYKIKGCPGLPPAAACYITLLHTHHLVSTQHRMTSAPAVQPAALSPHGLNCPTTLLFALLYHSNTRPATTCEEHSIVMMSAMPAIGWRTLWHTAFGPFDSYMIQHHSQ